MTKQPNTEPATAAQAAIRQRWPDLTALRQQLNGMNRYWFDESLRRCPALAEALPAEVPDHLDARNAGLIVEEKLFETMRRRLGPCDGWTVLVVPLLPEGGTAAGAARFFAERLGTRARRLLLPRPERDMRRVRHALCGSAEKVVSCASCAMRPERLRCRLERLGTVVVMMPTGEIEPEYHLEAGVCRDCIEISGFERKARRAMWRSLLDLLNERAP